ncbi:hypothetical protein ONV78_25200 [Hahella sp. CR1]|uniref:hypothetical protein n=1 Tax=Hahella sp. CR1 TaxID=2992807 RepID=UPI002442DC4E|nr:hypothetical protein [Hahella sp. CR1]MDG9671063.1 hypothetical protein [Hahella sp. CR1]
MLELNRERWAQLSHAFGEAGDIPEMLRELAKMPPSDTFESEPYFSLWNALCHQGDVYTASYAAVPHIVDILSRNPQEAPIDFFLLPVSIEITRLHGHGPDLSAELEEGYHKAIAMLPGLAAKAKPKDEVGVRVLAAVMAVVHGEAAMAEAIMELSPEVIEDFMEEI